MHVRICKHSRQRGSNAGNFSCPALAVLVKLECLVNPLTVSCDAWGWEAAKGGRKKPQKSELLSRVWAQEELCTLHLLGFWNFKKPEVA